MKITKLILLSSIIIIIILGSLLVTAVKPITTITSGTTSSLSLMIEFPQQERYQSNKNFTLHYHVFNSTAWMVRNDTTQCIFHFYNSTGNHLIAANALFDSNRVDFYYPIPPLPKGSYSAIIQCNQTQLIGEDTVPRAAGYLAHSVSVTDFVDYDRDPTSMIIIILIPIIFSILLIIGSISLNNEEHAAAKIFMLLLSFIPIFSSFHFSTLTIIHFFDFPILSDAIGTTTYWMSIMFGVLVTYFILYLIIKMIHNMAGKKKERLEYWASQEEVISTFQ